MKKSIVLLNRRSILYIFFLITISFLFHKTGNYFFAYDDFSLISYGSSSSIKTILLDPLIGFYRPAVFAFLKLQYGVFGWYHPAGYISVSVTLHIINAFLLFYIISKTTERYLKDNVVPALSSLIFLLSPWSAETFNWLSCQFNLLSTTGLLFTLILSVKFIESKNPLQSILIVPLVIISSLIAIFSKESAIVLPGYLALILLFKYDFKKLIKNKKFILIFILINLCLLVYIIARTDAIGTFDSGYGNYFVIFKRFSPDRLLYAFFMPPVKNTLVIHWIFLVLFIVSTVVMIFSSVSTNKKLSIFLIFGIIISIIPVIWGSITKFSSSGGRFIYDTGMFFAVLLAAGIYGLSTKYYGMLNRKILKVLPVLLILFHISYMVYSLNYQKNNFNIGSIITRYCINEFSRYLAKGKNFHITNLPEYIKEGPYLMRPSSFSHYYQNKNVKVTADTEIISIKNSRIKTLSKKFNKSTGTGEMKNEIVIKLNYEKAVEDLL